MNVNELEIIQSIIRILNDSQIPKSNLSSVLETLAERFSVTRSFLLIHQPETDRLSPIAVNNLSIADFRRLENKAEKRKPTCTWYTLFSSAACKTACTVDFIGAGTLCFRTVH